MQKKKKYNEVVVLKQGWDSSVCNSRPASGEVRYKKNCKKVHTLERDRELSGKMKRRKMKMEVKVQFKGEPLIIFHGPSLRI